MTLKMHSKAQCDSPVLVLLAPDQTLSVMCEFLFAGSR